MEILSAFKKCFLIVLFLVLASCSNSDVLQDKESAMSIAQEEALQYDPEDLGIFKGSCILKESAFSPQGNEEPLACAEKYNGEKVTFQTYSQSCSQDFGIYSSKNKCPSEDSIGFCVSLCGEDTAEYLKGLNTVAVYYSNNVYSDSQTIGIGKDNCDRWVKNSGCPSYWIDGPIEITQ